MARVAKRRFTVFSLSFLDVMSCGFGAVVLIFLVINHRIDTETPQLKRELLAEARKLDFLITTGRKDLADLQGRVEDTRKRVADARRRLLAKAADRDRRQDDVEELEARTIATKESIEALKTDVDSREQDVRRLQAEEEAQEGSRVREIKGEGDRQYLTGLFVGGRHVLIALDTSASMLDETIVQVIRRRNMDAERQRSAPKWRRALRTVEWLAAQLPLDSNFQIVLYAEQARLALPEQMWHAATDPDALDHALDTLDDILPAGGTNFDGLIQAAKALRPFPDNVFVITDGLPTRSADEPRRATVTGRQRLRLFRNATRQMPRGMPINVVLFPFEGDPMASAAYWQLASATGGTYMSPSADWP